MEPDITKILENLRLLAEQFAAMANVANAFTDPESEARYKTITSQVTEAADTLERLSKPLLASRIFDNAHADHDLFDQIQVIAGGRPTEECNQPGFVWHVTNSWTDWYDESVEIIMNPAVPGLTREQADKILAFGFSMIYESQGDRGTRWVKGGYGPCSTRKGSPGEYSVRERKISAERDNHLLYIQILEGISDSSTLAEARRIYNAKLNDAKKAASLT